MSQTPEGSATPAPFNYYKDTPTHLFYTLLVVQLLLVGVCGASAEWLLDDVLPELAHMLVTAAAIFGPFAATQQLKFRIGERLHGRSARTRAA